MTLRSILLTCLALLVPGLAQAQYQMISPMLYHGPAISYRDHVNAQRPRTDAPQQAGQAASGKAAAPVNLAAMTYRPDVARRRSNQAQFVAKTRAVDPAGAQDLEKMFAQADIIQLIGQELQKQDLRIDNLADAYAVWWITAWQATRGHNDDVSRAVVKAVRDQAARALAATPQFAGAGDAVKQEWAESLLIQTALIEAAVDQSKADRARMRDVGTAVNLGAKGMGLDLMTMKLTEQGFVPL